VQLWCPGKSMVKGWHKNALLEEFDKERPLFGSSLGQELETGNCMCIRIVVEL